MRVHYFGGFLIGLVRIFWPAYAKFNAHLHHQDLVSHRQHLGMKDLYNFEPAYADTLLMAPFLFKGANVSLSTATPWKASLSLYPFA